MLVILLVMLLVEPLEVYIYNVVIPYPAAILYNTIFWGHFVGKDEFEEDCGKRIIAPIELLLKDSYGN